MKKHLLALTLIILSLDISAQSKLPLGALMTYQPFLRSEQFTQRKLFQISSDVTEDSSVQISSSVVTPGSSWIWIKVSKDSEVTNSIYPVTTASIEKKIYLSQGPGMYQVDVMLTNQKSRYNSLYTYAGSFQVVNTDSRENMDALVPTTDIQSDSEVILELAQSLTQGLASDLDKSRAIHDFVTSQVGYDVKSFMDGSYRTGDQQDANTVLARKLAVCEGYSNLTAALHRAIGIPARKVIGEGIPEGGKITGITNHAWNEIMIDGYWILVDTTWDAGYINMKNEFVARKQNKYFNTHPAVFALNHKKHAKPQLIPQQQQAI